MRKGLLVLAATGLTALTMCANPAHGQHDNDGDVSVGGTVGADYRFGSGIASVYVGAYLNWKDYEAELRYYIFNDKISAIIGIQTRNSSVSLDLTTPILNPDPPSVGIEGSGTVDGNEISARVRLGLDLGLIEAAVEHTNPDIPLGVSLNWNKNDDGTSNFRLGLGTFLDNSESFKFKFETTFNLDPYDDSINRLDGFSTFSLFRDDVKLRDVTLPVTFYASGDPNNRTWGFNSRPVPIPPSLMGIAAVIPLSIGSALYRRSRLRKVAS
jgi:hypothetical protein